MRAREPALAWEATGSGVTVRTGQGTYAADRLVLTAGPWAGRLLGECGAPLTVMRQVALWFGTRAKLAPPAVGPTPEHFYRWHSYGVDSNQVAVVVATLVVVAGLGLLFRSTALGLH